MLRFFLGLVSRKYQSKIQSCAPRLGLVLVAIIAGWVPTSFAQEIDRLKGDFKRPQTISFPKNAPYSLPVAMLGKKLFFDPRLSGNQNLNCASCHNPSFGYEAPVAKAVGAGNKPLGRHAPTILNLAWTEHLFWDGRAGSLEEQAAGPITADVEMDGDFDTIVERLSNVEQYDFWFKKLFPRDGVTRENILTAIATYERTILSETAPFDEWVEGNIIALSKDAKEGFALFNGKAKCVECHMGWNFTDNKFHDIGLDTEDIGRFKLDNSSELMKFAFKTPGLRDLKYRAPFMHNGEIETLEDVIIHYVSGGIERPSRAKQIEPLDLSEKEQFQLKEFLLSLSSENKGTSLPILPN